MFSFILHLYITRLEFLGKMKNFFLIFILTLKIFKHCKCDLSLMNQNIIQSFNKEFFIKHLSIVKNGDFQSDCKILKFVKKLSGENVYASFLSTTELNDSMHDYYKTPGENYFFQNQEKGVSIEKKRENWVYPPKTIVMIYGPNITNTIDELFTHDNEFSVSKYLWLIFDDSNEFSKNNKNSYVPYNCHFYVLKASQDGYDIVEFYYPSIRSSVPFDRHIGTWKENKNELEIFEPNIYERRFNLNGTILHTLQFDPENRIRVFCYIFLSHISEIMNFRLVITPRDKKTENTKFGYEFLSIFNFVNLENYFPFLIWPLWEEPINLYISYDEKYEEHGISPFLRPFSYNLWIAVITWIITSGIIIMIISYITNSILESRIVLSDILYEPLESFLNQYGGEIPKNSPLKFVSAAARLAALFLTQAYTGAILSFILIPTLEFPFTNVKEFVEDGTYKLGYINSLNGAIMFKRSNDPWLKIAYDNFSESIIGEDNEIALFNAFNRICRDRKFVLLSVSPQNQKECDILKIPTQVFSGWLAIFLRYESPYKNAFNHVLKTLHSAGIVKRFKIWIEEMKMALGFKRIYATHNDSISVNIISVKTIFIITGILYLISVIVLTAEMCMAGIFTFNISRE